MGPATPFPVGCAPNFAPSARIAKSPSLRTGCRLAHHADTHTRPVHQRPLVGPHRAGGCCGQPGAAQAGFVWSVAAPWQRSATAAAAAVHPVPPPPTPPAAPHNEQAQAKEIPTTKRQCQRSELIGTDSKYLCSFCYDLLYVDTDAGRDICLNAACPSYANRGEIVGNIRGHEGPLHAQMLLQRSIHNLRKFSRKFLLGELYLARRSMCVSLLRGHGLHVSTFAAIEYLLAALGGDATWGHLEDRDAFRSSFNDYCNNFGIWQLVEQLHSKTYIVTPNGKPYAVKYHSALERFNNTQGIVSSANRQGRAALYAFSFIDNKTRGAPSKDAFDFEKMYKNSMRIVISLNHIFKATYTVSKIHAYPSRPEDIEALRSIWTTCRSGMPEKISRDKLHEIYRNAARKSGMRGDFDQFLRDYTSGEKYAPILVFDGEKYHYDYPTLLLYLIYLYSRNRSPLDAQTEAGSVIHGKKLQEAALHFEAKIRQRMHADGFDTYPKKGCEKFAPSFDNERREFDCIAVDHEQKIVVLIEAKYRDIPPSSMAGTTLVDHLVLDRQGGLLRQAQDHHARRQFFIRHFHDMKKHGLGLEGRFLDYKIHTIMVTKHDPLICMHKSVRIVSYEEFESIDFHDGSDARG